MKLASIGVCLLFALAAPAIPYTYTYTGDNFTTTDLPNEPGLTLGDRITVAFTFDSDLWGVVDARMGFGRLTTDLSGNILAWNISWASGGHDWAISGREDGSGRDIFAVNFYRGEDESPELVSGLALINYAPGTDHSTRWSFTPLNPEDVAVPDTGHTAILVLIALAPLFFAHRLPRTRPAPAIHTAVAPLPPPSSSASNGCGYVNG